jgi:threonine/homoserine/homoserine lactone efflux protein
VEEVVSVIGEILPEAIGVAISPIPIIAMVLMLGSSKGKSNGLAFLLGWLIGLGFIGTLVLLLSDPAGASTDSGPALWVGWLILVLGVLAILLGLKQWRSRPAPGEEAEMPKWMQALDQFTAGKSFGIGFLLAAVNPKNLILTLAAAATIASAGLSTAEEFGSLGVFVLIGTLGLLIPLGVYLFMGKRAPVILGDLNHWLGVHNSAIMAVLFVVIGFKLLGDGIQVVFA